VRKQYAFVFACALVLLSGLLLSADLAFANAFGKNAAQPPSAHKNTGVAVGPQYGTTHVYVASADFDAFVNSFVATFGGKPSKRTVGNVLPTSGSAELQYILSPVGSLSIFAFQTPIPFAFGQERTGSLVTDMDQAVKAARAAGAEVVVEPFKDPIGMDAIIQWPGGVKMQLYWHFTPPQSPPLETIPDNRVYVSRDEADHFVRCFLGFAHGKVLEDDKHADAGEIGRPGETYHRIRITSLFGNMQILVTDGHLPYPFGHEITGYQVQDLNVTLEKAKAVGVKVLFPPYAASDRTTTVVQFPGGYIAEIHSLKKR
jgi:hypothetical protein